MEAREVVLVEAAATEPLADCRHFRLLPIIRCTGGSPQGARDHLLVHDMAAGDGHDVGVSPMASLSKASSTVATRT